MDVNIEKSLTGQLTVIPIPVLALPPPFLPQWQCGLGGTQAGTPQCSQHIDKHALFLKTNQLGRSMLQMTTCL